MSNTAQQQNYTGQEEVIDLQIGRADALAICIDRPMGFWMFVVKNIVQGLFTALITAAVFKGLEYLKERKERKEAEQTAAPAPGQFRRAGE